MVNKSAAQNQVMIAPIFSMILVVASLSSIGSTWGQSSEVDEEIINISPTFNATGTSNETSASELQNGTKLNPGTSDNRLKQQSNLQSFAQNTVSCSAASNPCIGTDESDFMLGDAGINTMEGRKGDDIMLSLIHI